MRQVQYVFTNINRQSLALRLSDPSPAQYLRHVTYGRSTYLISIQFPQVPFNTRYKGKNTSCAYERGYDFLRIVSLDQRDRTLSTLQDERCEYRTLVRKTTCAPTCTIKPTTKTIATQETISAWFCITNSWLNIGGFLLELLRPFTATILSPSSLVHRTTNATRQTDKRAHPLSHALERFHQGNATRALRGGQRRAMWRSPV